MSPAIRWALFPGRLISAGSGTCSRPNSILMGNQQWVRQFGTHFEDLAYGVAVNSTSAYFVGFNDGEALRAQPPRAGSTPG